MRRFVLLLLAVSLVFLASAQGEGGPKEGTSEADAPPPPEPAVFGHLQVNVNALKSRVFVDGTFWGEANPGRPLNLRNVGLGEVAVRVEAKGYRSVTKPFVLKPNQWTQAVLGLPVISTGAVSPTSPPPSAPQSSAPASTSDPAPPADQPAPAAPPAPEVSPPAAQSAPPATEQPALPAGPSMRPEPESKPLLQKPEVRPSEPPAGTEADGMVFVPSGAFQMGSKREGEEAVHTVFLDGFWIDRHEVTVAAFSQFRPGYAPSAHSLCDRCPATAVSWADAAAYCEALGKRLPTEAEWEKACRGPEGYAYAWGNDDDRKKGHFGLEWNDRAIPVGSFEPNGYGTYDMSGNVWEWVQDWYDKKYYRNSPRENPQGPDGGKTRIIRGGAWYGGSKNVRCGKRYRSLPDRQSRIIGFRCVR